MCVCACVCVCVAWMRVGIHIVIETSFSQNKWLTPLSGQDGISNILPRNPNTVSTTFEIQFQSKSGTESWYKNASILYTFYTQVTNSF